MANMCRVLSHQITKTGASKIPSLRSKNHSVSRLNVDHLKVFFFPAWSAAAVVWITVSKMLLLKEPKLYVNLKRKTPKMDGENIMV